MVHEPKADGNEIGRKIKMREAMRHGKTFNETEKFL